MNNNNNNGSFIPAIIYNNVETEKLQILKDNKSKAGIYLWVHKESGKNYVGSAVDLSTRLGKYFSKNYLNKHKTMYICNALLKHDYSAFNLTILEYIDTTNLSKKEARLLILKREQQYLDNFEPKYNILKVAGSSLGFKHTEESLIKISKIHLGRIVSEETRAKMSLAKTGDNHPFYGKSHSADTKARISEIRFGKNNPMFGRIHSMETITKMSETKLGSNNPKSKKVFVYSNSTPTILEHEFVSYTEAAVYFSCSVSSIFRYLKSEKLFQGKWILSSSKK